ncbi:CCA tRNA nucleotidyltransferase [Curvivirga aplysinae]|uniref:CCA tRNA nucleotidyltransferase n=1 Tax=Curvivirga aplysinae TaxID=2529852 RepID=UPI0012BCDB5F|nr:CCA tRNA nucleotidyltransferase [Curvivirga aplysinae]MTI10254.1 CCA tRNA nucleotidyltransferase [Curvivirga aplysinae]
MLSDAVLVTTKLSMRPDWLDDPNILRLFQVLEAASIEGRFVGGCVRDFLVGREVHDFDIAVNRDPEYVMKSLEAAGLRVIPTGLSHGTITAVLDHVPYELTTLRKDVETDGRHAVVEFTDDWQEDAARRDFTMNALYMDVGGTLYDYFGGWDDLKDGHVRFVGDPRLRMTEDALRLLRYFRFSARYERQGFDQNVLAICKEFVSHLPRLATERIWQEWSKLLTIPKISSTLSAMNQIGMFDQMYRKMPVKVTDKDIAFLDQLNGGNPLQRLALLHGHFDQKEARQLANALRFSNAEKKYFIGLYTPREIFKDLSNRMFFQVYNKIGPDLVRDIAQLGQIRDEDGGWDKLGCFAEKTGQPEFPLLGRDVINMGVEAGPEVGQILQKVEDEWIGSGFQIDRETCLSRLEKIAKKE